MCISAVLGVSLVGVSLMSADVAVTVVRPEVISQRGFYLQWSNKGPLESSWRAASVGPIKCFHQKKKKSIRGFSVLRA
jgi:hypothetical protein